MNKEKFVYSLHFVVLSIILLTAGYIKCMNNPHYQTNQAVPRSPGDACQSYKCPKGHRTLVPNGCALCQQDYYERQKTQQKKK